MNLTWKKGEFFAYQSKSRRTASVGHNSSFYLEVAVVLARSPVGAKVLLNATDDEISLMCGQHCVRHFESAQLCWVVHEVYVEYGWPKQRGLGVSKTFPRNGVCNAKWKCKHRCNRWGFFLSSVLGNFAGSNINSLWPHVSLKFNLQSFLVFSVLAQRMWTFIFRKTWVGLVYV